MKQRKTVGKKGNSFFRSFERLMRCSIFARVLLFFGSLQEKHGESVIIDALKKVFKRPNVDGKMFRPFRQAMTKEIEQSAILNFADSFFEMLLYAPLRLYGMLFMTFSVYTVAIGMGKSYLQSSSLSFSSDYIRGGVILILSLFLLFAPKKKTFAESVLESRVFSFILFDMLGVERRAFIQDRRIEGGYLVTFLCGTLLALLAVFVPLWKIVCAVLLIIFLRIAFLSPESGLLCATLTLSLIPENIFIWMLVMVAFSFFIKLLRGKRSLKTNFYGWILFVFTVLVCFAGWIRPVGQTGGMAGKVFVLTFGFFLCHLMMRHGDWVNRCSSVLSMSALIAALWGTMVFLLKLLPAKYEEIFTFIPEKDFPAGFENVESFGLFVAACCPIFLVRYMGNRQFKDRVPAILALVPFFVSIVLSRSPMVWIAFLLSVLFFMILHRSEHLITAAVSSAALVLGYFFFLPTSFKETIKNFSNGFSVSFKTVWRQIVESFERIFMAEGGGVEGGNFYSHLLLSVGIIGLILLLLTVFGSWCFAFYACDKGKKDGSELRRVLRGYSVSLFTLLISGVGCDFFVDGKLLYLFFFLPGLIFSTGEVLCKDSTRQTYSTDLDRDFVYFSAPRSALFSGRKGKRQKSKRKTEHMGHASALMYPTEKIARADQPRDFSK